MKATGSFVVEFSPLDCSLDKKTLNFSRMNFKKTFSGDLVGFSEGEMTSVRTSLEKSAGYIALEYVEAELGNKKGDFAFQHYGIMNRGDDFLKLEVVPDSASGELEGLSGSLTIKIENGVHYYEFEYVFKT